MKLMMMLDDEICDDIDGDDDVCDDNDGDEDDDYNRDRNDR